MRDLSPCAWSEPVAAVGALAVAFTWFHSLPPPTCTTVEASDNHQASIGLEHTREVSPEYVHEMGICYSNLGWHFIPSDIQRPELAAREVPELGVQEQRETQTAMSAHSCAVKAGDICRVNGSCTGHCLLWWWNLLGLSAEQVTVNCNCSPYMCATDRLCFTFL